MLHLSRAGCTGTPGVDNLSRHAAHKARSLALEFLRSIGKSLRTALAAFAQRLGRGVGLGVDFAPEELSGDVPESGFAESKRKLACAVRGKV